MLKVAPSPITWGKEVADEACVYAQVRGVCESVCVCVCVCVCVRAWLHACLCLSIGVSMHIRSVGQKDFCICLHFPQSELPVSQPLHAVPQTTTGNWESSDYQRPEHQFPTGQFCPLSPFVQSNLNDKVQTCSYYILDTLSTGKGVARLLAKLNREPQTRTKPYITPSYDSQIELCPQLYATHVSMLPSYLWLLIPRQDWDCWKWKHQPHDYKCHTPHIIFML